MKTIMVSIICYEDLDVLKTVANLYETAAHPQRVRTVVILQSDRPELFAGLEAYAEVVHFPAAWAEGCGKARAEAISRYESEDFFFQLDSHMRFEAHWDELLINETVACPADKPILTTLPAGFVIATEERRPPIYSHIVIREFFRHLPIVWGHHTSLSVYVPTPVPAQTAFIAGGCLFGPGSICRDVPYDPRMYFHGEEHSVNMRLWTHGYDNFSPRFSFVYHAYRADQVDHVTLQSRISPERDLWLHERSVARAQVLTGVRETGELDAELLTDLDLFGLGAQRTVAQWEERFDINLKNQTFRRPT